VAEVTKGADVVMTSLPMPGRRGGDRATAASWPTFPRARPIDLSTNAPSMVKKIGAAMAAKGIASARRR
jgi:hypothetical protein